MMQAIRAGKAADDSCPRGLLEDTTFDVFDECLNLLVNEDNSRLDLDEGVQFHAAI
jgi:hypothetical protein